MGNDVFPNCMIQLGKTSISAGLAEVVRKLKHSFFTLGSGIALPASSWWSM